ncbi:MAG: tetratricopeptide repeat protein [Desulfobacula sp.]|nr:tetratricopeptide repeat protein [Desulfobacula sp.]
MKNRDKPENDAVKKQTLIGAVILSLIIGFIGGTVYSSIKLGNTSVKTSNPANVNQANISQDQSDEISSKILSLEQYLKTNSKDAKAWAQLGNMFFDSDQYTNAIDAYQKSLAITPDQVGVITDMGVMYRRNKQPQKAIEAFDKVILIDPTYETSRFNKGIVLLHDLNDIEGGIRAWEKIVEMNPVAMAPNGDSVDALIQKMKTKK